MSFLITTQTLFMTAMKVGLRSVITGMIHKNLYDVVTIIREASRLPLSCHRSSHVKSRP